jgi:acyl carrier protein
VVGPRASGLDIVKDSKLEKRTAEAERHMDKGVIVKELIAILNDMTGDWETEFQEQIGPTTRLVGDLAFGSIDVVQLAVAIEEHFGQPGLPWEKMLLIEGNFVDDLRVDQVADFLADQLKP